MISQSNTSESPLSSLSYQSSYISRRYSVQAPLTSVIRPITPLRLEGQAQPHTVRPRSVPNIKLSGPNLQPYRPQPNPSGLTGPCGEAAEAVRDNIETELENLCLSVTERVLEK